MIVVDVSGSMKGLKMTIAKHTINTILDTLGENDFVNVIAVRACFFFHLSSLYGLISIVKYVFAPPVLSTLIMSATWSPVLRERWCRQTWTTAR